MPTSESTCWTVIRAAAAGSPADREELARRYLGVVRAYLAARWRGSATRDDVDDATQEVFVECFRRGGALEAAGAGRVPGFRAFLYGVIRNVARRFESRPVRAAGSRCPTSRRTRPANPASSTGPGHGRSWWRRPSCREPAADERGPEAVQRVELLRLRFEENLPIRAIAERWGVDARALHHAYALARKEFQGRAPGGRRVPSARQSAELEEEAASLLKALS